MVYAHLLQPYFLSLVKELRLLVAPNSDDDPQPELCSKENDNR